MKIKRIFAIALWMVSITAIVVVAASQKSEDQRQLLPKLYAADWQERDRAVSKLIGNQDILTEQDVRIALVDLLDRENRLIEETLRESNGAEGVSVKYGEGYSEYYSRLLGAVMQTADFADSRAVSALAHSSYDPGSLIVKELAAHANAIAPVVLELTSSDISSIRCQAYGVLGEILSSDNHQTNSLAPEVRDQIKETLVRGAHDEDIGVRIQTVRALGKSGDPDSLTLLENILSNDSGAVPAAEPDKNIFPVRQEALRAIIAIRQAIIKRPL
jgi:HEAT repeat protein